MLSTDQSHLRKYLATLGVAIVAGVISLSGLFLRMQDELLIKQSDLAALSPDARSTVVRRQHYIDVATSALPWFLLLGCSIGLVLAGYGVVGWSRRQSVADELENIARDRGKTELRRLTDAERVGRLEREAGTAVAEVKGTTGAELDDGAGSSGTPSIVSSERRATYNLFLQRFMETELELAVAVERLLGPHYQIELGVEVRREGKRREFDIVATPKAGGHRFVFEMKYVRFFAKGYRASLVDAITTVTAGANLLGGSTVPVVVLVYEGSLSNEQLERAQAHAEELASSFVKPPRVAFVSTTELRDSRPAPLARVLEAS